MALKVAIRQGIALKIIETFEGKIIHIDKKDKPSYHMAACIISIIRDPFLCCR